MAARDLGPDPSIHPTAQVAPNCALGRYTEVGARTRMSEASMGDYSYIVNDGNVIYADIGKFCSIAAMARINPGNHPMDRAAQHHFSYRAAAYGLGENDADFFQWRRDHWVSIGHDVWIGHGAIVMPGVSIGTGAVIGAGAVVTHDVEPYMKAAGVPARPIGERFSRDLAARLAALAWWDWPHDRLRRALTDFRELSVEAFLEKHEV